MSTTVDATETVNPVSPPPEPPPEPRKRGRPPTTERSRRVVFLPKPLKFSMKPDQFFSYWSKIDKAHPGRATAYVYRAWPRCDRTLSNPDNDKYIVKLDTAFETPEEWRDEMLHRFGSGDYKLILSDGLLSKSVGQTFITGLRDDERPPVINLDELVMDDPVNRSYVESLRLKGALPKEESEQEMATAQTLDKAMDTIERLSAKAATPPPPPPPPPAPSAIDQSAALQSIIGTMADATKVSQGLIVDALTKANASNDPTAQLAIVDKVIGVMEKARGAGAGGGGGDSPGNAALVAQMIEVMKAGAAREADLNSKLFGVYMARVDSLEKLLTDKATNPAIQTQSPAPPKSMLETIQEMGKIKDTMRDLLGIGGESDEEPAADKPPWWANLASSIAQGLPALGGALVAASYNIAVAKTGQGQPISPVAGQPAPGQPASLPAGGNPALGSPAHPAASVEDMYGNFLRQIERPLLDHLNRDDRNGYDFANLIIDYHGRRAYDEVHELGKEALTAILMAYQPIGEVIRRTPSRFAEFLDDFFDRDQIHEELEQEDEDLEDEGLVAQEMQKPVRVRKKKKAARVVPVEATVLPS